MPESMTFEESEDEFQKRHAAWIEHMIAVDHKAMLILGKNRHGPTRDIQLFFDGNITKFSNLENSEEGSPYGTA